MAGRKKKEAPPLERVLELIDEKVKEAGDHTLAAHDLNDEITKLASEARRQGASMSELTQRVRKMDVKDRALKPVPRQAVDNRLAVHENRRPARTTRASRRKREPAGQLNAAALQ
jgi:hypothetical protein